MKVISSFVPLLAAVAVFASDSPPGETHQVLHLADAWVVVLRLSVVVEGEGPKQCQEKFVDAMLKSLVGRGLLSPDASLQGRDTSVRRRASRGRRFRCGAAGRAAAHARSSSAIGSPKGRIGIGRPRRSGNDSVKSIPR